MQQGRDGDRFEPVVWHATAGDFSAKGRAFPRLDQTEGEVAGIEVTPNVGPQALTEGRAPAVENAHELSAYRLARTAELERQVPDQAAEQEIAGLVFVGQLVEETRDSLLRRPVRVQDRQQPRLDVFPVMLENRRGKGLLAREIRVERTLRDAGRVRDVLDAAGRESARSEEHTSELQSRQYLVCRLL